MYSGATKAATYDGSVKETWRCEICQNVSQLSIASEACRMLRDLESFWKIPVKLNAPTCRFNLNSVLYHSDFCTNIPRNCEITYIMDADDLLSSGWVWKRRTKNASYICGRWSSPITFKASELYKSIRGEHRSVFPSSLWGKYVQWRRSAPDKLRGMGPRGGVLGGEGSSGKISLRVLKKKWSLLFWVGHALMCNM